MLPTSLTPRQLSRVVDQSAEALQRCYDTWLRAHPLRGQQMFELRAEVVVHPDGTTQEVQLHGIDDQPALGTCITSVAQRWRFPRSLQGAEFVAPLLLAGRERPDDDVPQEQLPLRAAQVHAAVSENAPTLGACLEPWLREHGTSPRVVAVITIQADGSTRAAQLRGTELPPAIKTCVRNVLLAWRFPRAGKAAEYAFPVLAQASTNGG